MQIQIDKDQEELARHFAEFIKEQAAGKDVFHLALSGGSTPKILFRILASSYKDSIPWEKFRFYWGDERCVPPDHSESNYGMTKALLLDPLGISPDQVFRIRGEDDPENETLRYSQLLHDNLPLVQGFPRFDLIILGMGDDGHTASIFPHELELWNDMRYCVTAVHPQSGQQRVSLSGNVINAGKTVAFLVSGSGKAAKVKQILREEQNYRDLPAWYVRPTQGDLFWFLDKAAAALLLDQNF